MRDAEGKDRRMEGSSPSIEEERTATFYVYRPCYFLQQALRALLKCVGIDESENTMCSQANKQEKSSLPQTPSADDPITNSPTHKSSPDAADPPSTTNQTIVCAMLPSQSFSTCVICVCLCAFLSTKQTYSIR